MPLTPEDVSNKRFSPVRLREGYDMGEVDQFLDEVEAELVRLTRENDDLRTKLSSAQHGGAEQPAAPERTEEAKAQTEDQTDDLTENQPETESEPEAASDSASDAEPVSAPVAPVETIKVASIGEASSAAARLLELATRSADQLVGEAKEEAETMLGEARATAERLEGEAKAKADRVESDARTRSQMLDTETSERRQQLFGALEREKDELGAEVENLRSFEREYRSRLKSYFEQQLATLEGNDGPDHDGDGIDQGAPRPTSLLADDSDS